MKKISILFAAVMISSTLVGCDPDLLPYTTDGATGHKIYNKEPFVNEKGKLRYRTKPGTQTRYFYSQDHVYIQPASGTHAVRSHALPDRDSRPVN